MRLQVHVKQQLLQLLAPQVTTGIQQALCVSQILLPAILPLLPVRPVSGGTIQRVVVNQPVLLLHIRLLPIAVPVTTGIHLPILVSLPVLLRNTGTARLA